MGGKKDLVVDWWGEIVVRKWKVLKTRPEVVRGTEETNDGDIS